MKWLLDNNCPWDSNTFAKAAFCGNLENMIFLFENGFSWDSGTFYCAEKHGNLENIQWLKENGCPQYET
jgi:hypothetical protein